MPLNPKEELELLQLEEEEYQHSLNQSAKPVSEPKLIGDASMGQLLQGGSDSLVSSAPAIAAGAAQGSTFGFSDELGAGVDVASDVIKQGLSGQVPDMLGIPAKWRAFQKSREAENKRLAEESPIAYVGGELAGGVGSALLTPGIGAAKIAGSAAKLSPGLAKFLAGKTGSSLANIAGKGATAAIEGAPLGAAYGLGASEHDLSSSPEELLKDAASGAAMGSIGGAALGASSGIVSELVDGTKNYLAKRDFGRNLSEAYKYGKEGVNFSTTEGQDQISRLARDYPDQFTNTITAIDKKLGEEVGLGIEAAQNAGVSINIQPELLQATDNLFKNLVKENPNLLGLLDSKSSSIIGLLNTKGLSKLKPLEARGLKKALEDVISETSSLQGDATAITRKHAIKLKNSLSEIMQNTPGMEQYNAAAKKFSTFRELIPETILEPGVPLDKRVKFLGDLQNKNHDLLGATKDLLSSGQLPGSSVTSGARTGIVELGDNLKTLNNQYPDLSKALGGATPEESFAKIRNIADKFSTMTQGQGRNPHAGVKKTLTGTVVGSGEGLVLGGANKLGLIAGSAPVKTAQSIYNAGNDKLLKLAAKMKSGSSGIPGSELIGESLEKALMNKDDVAKNAVLFKLLQVPQYREMLRSEGAQ
jgi:hypothetical protein